MNQSHHEFLTAVLSKVARRYEQRGRLSGVMKVGTSLDHEQLQILHHFFGIQPIRINQKDEVRIHFDFALKNMQESELLEKISSHLGHRLLSVVELEQSHHACETIITRLKLGFPDLRGLTETLSTSPDALVRLLKSANEKEATTLCFQAAETVLFLLKNTTPVTISELGARFFTDSKLLRQGEARNLLLEWLNVYCPDLDYAENEEQIWETYHVYHDRLTVNAVIYGPVVYTKQGKEFDWIYQLYKEGEAATITWANLQDIEEIHWKERGHDPPRLICCENEAPFSQLIRRQKNDCLLFTSGFPGSAVRKIYGLLAPQAASCHHWGDTDPSGLHIASLLHSIYPLKLYRCDIETVRQHSGQLLSLSAKQQQRAMLILIHDHRFPFREELAYTLEHGWLEQENWRQN